MCTEEYEETILAKLHKLQDENQALRDQVELLEKQSKILDSVESFASKHSYDDAKILMSFFKGECEHTDTYFCELCGDSTD